MSWPERAQISALTLSSGEEREDDSITALLLRDIHGIFTSNGHDRMKTSDLLAYLYEIEESPWGDWYGKPLSAHGLSRLLRPYRIKTLPVWVDGITVRGYKLEQFEDAHARVVSVRSVRRVRSESASHAAPNVPNAPNALTRNNGEGRVPVSGDPAFPDWIDGKLQDGWITEAEWLERRRLHDLVERAA
jgi:Protein of unknown function (DUF3631)